MTWRPASSHHKNTKSESAPVWLWLWLWLSCACGCGCGSRVPVAVAVTLWLCGSVALAPGYLWLWLWLPCGCGCGSRVPVALAVALVWLWPWLPCVCACARAGKTHINYVQLEAGAPKGPQNRRSRAGETTTFSKRCALVYAKRQHSGIGPRRASPSKPSCGQPGTNASSTVKKKRPPVQVKRLPILCCWKLEGPRALRTGAPVYAKRQLSPKGTLSST